MTTILWHPKDQKLIADMRNSWDDGAWQDSARKIAIGKDFAVGFAGNRGYVERFLSKHKGLKEVLAVDIIDNMFDELEKLVSDSNNGVDAVLVMWDVEQNLRLYQFSFPGIFTELDANLPYAIGSGANYALGACYTGADAQKCLQAASAFDSKTSFQTYWVEI